MKLLTGKIKLGHSGIMANALITLASIVLCAPCLSQIPSVRIQTDSINAQLEILQLSVDIEIVGNVATTTYDVVFYNHTKRDLEGELSMPLNDRQEIYRYALEISGKLREGVIVEKIKARQTYEAIVRRNIDPGLVNKTKGNFFKTRIYPIPAKGTKRVVIAIAEVLTGDEKNLYYSLPVVETYNIEEFKLNVNVNRGSVANNKVLTDFENLQFDTGNKVDQLRFQRKNYALSKSLKFTIPRFSNSSYQSFTQDFKGTRYFYVNVKPPELRSNSKTPPNHICIYWDNSFSAAKRDIAKELTLLSDYLTSLPGTKTVAFVAFNYREGAPVYFQISNDASALIKHIHGLKSDGATRLDNLQFNIDSDEVLFFSDAINTISDANLNAPGVRFYSIISSFGSNYNLLKRVASTSNGTVINLNRVTLDKALELLLSETEKLVSIEYESKHLEQVYPNTPGEVTEYVEITGIMVANQAELKLNFGYPGNITNSQILVIDENPGNSVARIWANNKIEDLEYDFEKNQRHILQLGKKFNIVTRNSALLVLDRIEDYVQHNITPPDELKAEYERLILAKKTEVEPALDLISERNLKRFELLKSWYQSPVPKTNTSKLPVNNQPPPADIIEVPDAQGIEEEIEVNLDVEATEESEIEDIVFEEAPSEEIQGLFQRLNPENTSNSYSPMNAVESDQASKGPSIKVLAWLPDAPYMKELRGAEDKDLVSLYYKLKEANISRPAFYVQVADFFFEKNRNIMAIQVLSNVIELDLENPELLKIVARRFLNEGAYELAITIFQEIRDLRPEEPQSFRDLAMAFAASKQYQEACDLYVYILETDWERFTDIKDVVFNELNHLITLHGEELDLSKVNPDYIQSMPLDIRILVEWSSNDNDIDLWVIDPSGEKCYYQNRNTKIGGKLTRDFTRGYGPEEYSIRSAKRGTYTVYVNYYSDPRQSIIGPVTVYATLYTHYGTSQQKSEKIAIQLIEDKDTRQLGQLEFEH